MFGILRGNKKKKSYRKSTASVYSMEEDVPCFLPEDFNFQKNREGKYVFDGEGFQEDMEGILDVLQCQGDYDDETVNTRRTKSKSSKSVTQNKNVDLTLESPTDLVRSLSNVIMGVESDDGNTLETYDYSTKKNKKFSKWNMFRKRKNKIDEESVMSEDREDGFSKIISDLSFGAINTSRFMKDDSDDDYTEEEESIISRQKSAYSKGMTRSSPSVKRSVVSRAASPHRPRLNTAPSRISSRAQSSIAKSSLGMRSAASVVSRKSYLSRATYKSRMSRKTSHSTKVKGPVEKPVVAKNTAPSVNIVQGLNTRKQYLPSPFAKKEVAKPDEFVIAISDDGDKENDNISILTDDPKLTESAKKKLEKSSVPNLGSWGFSRSSDNHSTALSYKNPKHRMVQKSMQKARTRMEYAENYLESLPKNSFKEDEKRKNRSLAKNKYADETSVVVTTRSSQGRVVKNMVSLKSGLR
ncbi:predicted protein [Chaetoceros tenuissimus]|uniref:Uncharacterized protein n=1 Tax=Chaetoceros tenuissimus TaxID=426638 RepID=A0AAD3CI34_9STRA|nr:predicted protein [Chaetoceros tenuissimus]